MTLKIKIRKWDLVSVMTNAHYVYAHSDPVTNLIRYVGKGKNDRASYHGLTLSPSIGRSLMIETLSSWTEHDYLTDIEYDFITFLLKLNIIDKINYNLSVEFIYVKKR